MALRELKYWQIIIENLRKAGWSWGCLLAVDALGRTIWTRRAPRRKTVHCPRRRKTDCVRGIATGDTRGRSEFDLVMPCGSVRADGKLTSFSSIIEASTIA